MAITASGQLWPARGSGRRSHWRRSPWCSRLSLLTFWAIKATIGLRVSEEEELAGLDIATHGMYGYPEQFIPQPEFPAPLVEPHVAGTPVAAMTPNPTPAPGSGVA